MGHFLAGFSNLKQKTKNKFKKHKKQNKLFVLKNIFIFYFLLEEKNINDRGVLVKLCMS